MSFYIRASINGHVRDFHFPKHKDNASEIMRIARDGFSHQRCDWVKVCDHEGPVRCISYAGEVYEPQPTS